MAGGKETPRQKMIGMMYLVLTALLALNVSKEIVEAFVTINDKLDGSSMIIEQTSNSIYGTFDSKRAAIIAEKGDTKAIDLWQGKAETLKKRTKHLVHFILSESNELITRVTGKDWVANRDDNGLIFELKSLSEIDGKDNFDISSELFVGGNPMAPNERGMAILDSIHAYRNYVTELMGNYKVGDKQWNFVAPDDIDGLESALATANPEDTTALAQTYKALTLPKEIVTKDAGKEVVQPWAGVMFYHAPVVAGAAIFTSLKLDAKNGESKAADFMLSKVDAPTFNFNKIEPLAFARTGYINAGDSLSLRVMIAAYDSTDVPPIRYGINDTVPSNWKETSGAIRLEGKNPGSYRATGVIGVKEKGELTWRPWEYSYSVGKPSGTVSLPDMNVLYRGFDNRVEGAASGFPSYSLTGGGNVTITKTATGYIAKPGNGNTAKINIAGVAEDGSSSSLGSFEFSVKDLPKPNISFGNIQDGEAATASQFKSSPYIKAGYPPEITLNVKFSIVSWELSTSGSPRAIVGNGPNLSAEAMRVVANTPVGSMISIRAKYNEPSGNSKFKTAVFKKK